MFAQGIGRMETQSDSLCGCFCPPVASCLVDDMVGPVLSPQKSQGNGHEMEHHPLEGGLPRQSQYGDPGSVLSLAQTEVDGH